MASSITGIRAGRAFVEIYAENSKFRKGLVEAQSELKSFESSIRKITQAFSFTALPIAYSVKLFSDFDDTLRTIASTTGNIMPKASGAINKANLSMIEVGKSASESVAEMRSIEQLARKIGKETSFTAKQAAESMLILARAGKSVAEINNMTEGVLDLAKATGSDVTTAALTAVNALNMFEIQASKTVRVVDLLATTANTSPQNLTDIGNALKYIGPVANAVNISLNETLKDLGLLAKLGIKGEQGGSSLRNMYMRMASTLNQKKFKDVFNVDFIDAEGNLRNVTDVLREAKTNIDTLGISMAKTTAVFKDVFSMRALPSSFALLQAASKASELSTSSSVSRARMAAAQQEEGIGGGFRSALSRFQEIGLAFAKSIEAPMRSVLDTIVKISDKIIDLIKDFSGFIEVGAKALGMFGKTFVKIAVFAGALKIIEMLKRSSSELNNSFKNLFSNLTKRRNINKSDFDIKLEGVDKARESARLLAQSITDTSSAVARAIERFNRLSSVMPKVSSATPKVNIEILKLHSGFVSLGVSINKANGLFNSLKAITNNFKKSLSETSTRVLTIRKRLFSASVAAGSMGKALDKIASNSSKIDDPLTDIGLTVELLAGTFDALSYSVFTAADFVQSFSKVLKNNSKAVGGFANKMERLAKSSLNLAKGFEKAMQEIQNLFNSNVASQQTSVFQALIDVLVELASSTRKSWDGLSKAKSVANQFNAAMRRGIPLLESYNKQFEKLEALSTAFALAFQQIYQPAVAQKPQPTPPVVVNYSQPITKVYKTDYQQADMKAFIDLINNFNSSIGNAVRIQRAYSKTVRSFTHFLNEIGKKADWAKERIGKFVGSIKALMSQKGDLDNFAKEVAKYFSAITSNVTSTETALVAIRDTLKSVFNNTAKFEKRVINTSGVKGFSKYMKAIESGSKYLVDNSAKIESAIMSMSSAFAYASVNAKSLAMSLGAFAGGKSFGFGGLFGGPAVDNKKIKRASPENIKKGLPTIYATELDYIAAQGRHSAAMSSAKFNKGSYELSLPPSTASENANEAIEQSRIYTRLVMEQKKSELYTRRVKQELEKMNRSSIGGRKIRVGYERAKEIMENKNNQYYGRHGLRYLMDGYNNKIGIKGTNDSAMLNPGMTSKKITYTWTDVFGYTRNFTRSGKELARLYEQAMKQSPKVAKSFQSIFNPKEIAPGVMKFTTGPGQVTYGYKVGAQNTNTLIAQAFQGRETKTAHAVTLEEHRNLYNPNLKLDGEKGEIRKARDKFKQADKASSEVAKSLIADKDLYNIYGKGGTHEKMLASRSAVSAIEGRRDIEKARIEEDKTMTDSQKKSAYKDLTRRIKPEMDAALAQLKADSDAFESSKRKYTKNARERIKNLDMFMKFSRENLAAMEKKFSVRAGKVAEWATQFNPNASYQETYTNLMNKYRKSAAYVRESDTLKSLTKSRRDIANSYGLGQSARKAISELKTERVAIQGIIDETKTLLNTANNNVAISKQAVQAKKADMEIKTKELERLKAIQQPTPQQLGEITRIEAVINKLKQELALEEKIKAEREAIRNQYKQDLSTAKSWMASNTENIRSVTAVQQQVKSVNPAYERPKAFDSWRKYDAAVNEFKSKMRENVTVFKDSFKELPEFIQKGFPYIGKLGSALGNLAKGFGKFLTSITPIGKTVKVLGTTFNKLGLALRKVSVAGKIATFSIKAFGATMTLMTRIAAGITSFTMSIASMTGSMLMMQVVMTIVEKIIELGQSLWRYFTSSGFDRAASKISKREEKKEELRTKAEESKEKDTKMRDDIKRLKDLSKQGFLSDDNIKEIEIIKDGIRKNGYAAAETLDNIFQILQDVGEYGLKTKSLKIDEAGLKELTENINFDTASDQMAFLKKEMKDNSYYINQANKLSLKGSFLYYGSSVGGGIGSGSFTNTFTKDKAWKLRSKKQIDEDRKYLNQVIASTENMKDTITNLKEAGVNVSSFADIIDKQINDVKKYSNAAEENQRQNLLSSLSDLKRLATDKSYVPKKINFEQYDEQISEILENGLQKHIDGIEKALSSSSKVNEHAQELVDGYNNLILSLTKAIDEITQAQLNHSLDIGQAAVAEGKKKEYQTMLDNVGDISVEKLNDLYEEQQEEFQFGGSNFTELNRKRKTLIERAKDSKQTRLGQYEIENILKTNKAVEEEKKGFNTRWAALEKQLLGDNKAHLFENGVDFNRFDVLKNQELELAKTKEERAAVEKKWKRVIEVLNEKTSMSGKTYADLINEDRKNMESNIESIRKRSKETNFESIVDEELNENIKNINDNFVEEFSKKQMELYAQFSTGFEGVSMQIKQEYLSKKKAIENYYSSANKMLDKQIKEAMENGADEDIINNLKSLKEMNDKYAEGRKATLNDKEADALDKAFRDQFNSMAGGVEKQFIDYINSIKTINDNLADIIEFTKKQADLEEEIKEERINEATNLANKGKNDIYKTIMSTATATINGGEELKSIDTYINDKDAIDAKKKDRLDALTELEDSLQRVLDSQVLTDADQIFEILNKIEDIKLSKELVETFYENLLTMQEAEKELAGKKIKAWLSTGGRFSKADEIDFEYEEKKNEITQKYNEAMEAERAKALKQGWNEEEDGLTAEMERLETGYNESLEAAKNERDRKLTEYRRGISDTDKKIAEINDSYAEKIQEAIDFYNVSLEDVVYDESGNVKEVKGNKKANKAINDLKERRKDEIEKLRAESSSELEYQDLLASFEEAGLGELDGRKKIELEAKNNIRDMENKLRDMKDKIDKDDTITKEVKDKRKKALQREFDLAKKQVEQKADFDKKLFGLGLEDGRNTIEEVMSKNILEERQFIVNALNKLGNVDNNKIMYDKNGNILGVKGNARANAIIREIKANTNAKNGSEIFNRLKDSNEYEFNKQEYLGDNSRGRAIMSLDIQSAELEMRKGMLGENSPYSAMIEQQIKAVEYQKAQLTYQQKLDQLQYKQQELGKAEETWRNAVNGGASVEVQKEAYDAYMNSLQDATETQKSAFSAFKDTLEKRKEAQQNEQEKVDERTFSRGTFSAWEMSSQRDNWYMNMTKKQVDYLKEIRDNTASDSAYI